MTINMKALPLSAMLALYDALRAEWEKQNADVTAWEMRPDCQLTAEAMAQLKADRDATAYQMRRVHRYLRINFSIGLDRHLMRHKGDAKKQVL